VAKAIAASKDWSSNGLDKALLRGDTLWDSAHLFSSTGEHAVAITRIAERQWHALEDDQVVGRGEVSHRHDGRLFLIFAIIAPPRSQAGRLASAWCCASMPGGRCGIA
jgi:hypothetical protein